MAYTSKRPGLVAPSSQLSKSVRELVRETGADEAAKKLGVSRETALAVGCGALVARGTVAMVQNALAASVSGRVATIGGK